MVQAYLPAFDDFMVNKCDKKHIEGWFGSLSFGTNWGPSPFSEPQISYRYLYSYPIQHIPFTNGWCPLPFLSSFLIVKSDILNYISWNIPAKKNIALVGQNIYHTIGSLENLPHGRKNLEIFSSPGRPRAPPLCRWLNGACQAWKIRVVIKTSLFSGSMEMVQWKISPVPYSEIPKNLL